MDIKQNKYRKTYNAEFKLQAVRLHTEHGYSANRVALELDVARSMVQRWLHYYKAEGEAGLEEKRGHMSTGRPRVKVYSREEELQARIRRLEMEVAVLKKLKEIGGRDSDPQ